jgi:hypothetical protein
MQQQLIKIILQFFLLRTALRKKSERKINKMNTTTEKNENEKC